MRGDQELARSWLQLPFTPTEAAPHPDGKGRFFGGLAVGAESDGAFARD